MDRVELVLDSSYEIKYEPLEKFDQSIFRDVYRKAAGMTAEIISKNRKQDKEYDDRFRKEEQICNVIAFLGGRGSGKSSVLASECKFLSEFYGRCREYKEKMCPRMDEEIRSLFEMGEKYELSFNVLDTIDATLLGDNEKIIEIVLARMLEKIQEREEMFEKRAVSYHENKKRGRDLYTEIGELYRYIHGRQDREEDSPVLMVEALSNSWNLRDAFKKLVKNCNEYLNYSSYNSGYEEDGSYLVIPIDDIDMNVDKCWEMLEMIRKYLMVPKVILLLTLNLEQLTIVCRNYYENVLFNKHGLFTEGEDKRFFQKRVSELTREYMEKVIPTGRKIYMPQLYQLEPFLKKQIVIKGSGLDGMKTKLEIALRPEEYISVMLRFYTGVICSASKRNQYTYPPSIRKLSNFIKEFTQLKRPAGEDALIRIRYNIDWLYEDVSNRFLEQYVEVEDIQTLRQYLNEVKERQNRLLLHALSSKLSGRKNPPQQWRARIQKMKEKPRVTYGDQLELLLLARESGLLGENAGLCWNLLISIKMARLCFDVTVGGTPAEAGTYLDGDLWGEWDSRYWYWKVEDGCLTKMEASAILGEVYIQMKFLGEENQKKTMSPQELFMLYELISIFFDMKEQDSGEPDVKRSVGDDIVLYLDKTGKGRFSLGNLISFIWDYQRKLETVDKDIRNQYHAQKEEGASCEEFFSLAGKMKEWADTYQTREIVPFYSTFFMENILEQFYTGKKAIGNFKSELMNLLEIMKKELHELDKLAGWDTILETDIKRKEICTLRSSVAAFEACPVIRILMGEEEEQKVVTERFYWYMTDLLERMAKDPELGENTYNTKYEI